MKSIFRILFEGEKNKLLVVLLALSLIGEVIAIAILFLLPIYLSIQNGNILKMDLTKLYPIGEIFFVLAVVYWLLGGFKPRPPD